MVQEAAAALALNRFGLGPRPGELGAIGDDPRGALLAELERPGIALVQDDRLSDTGVLLAERRRETAEQAVAPTTPAEGAMTLAMPAAPPFTRRVLLAEVAVRIDRALAAKTGIIERLVAFWTNHFAVEARSNSIVRCLAGAFEREAIRPHVLGRFEDMLVAATTHPAMLVYLDTFRSVGPNSILGETADRGLNENHARELLELHTVGVGARYSQADVTAFARVLTGWSFAHGEGKPLGRFLFRAKAHEPGAQTIMGVSYSQPGVAQGEAVLRDLARHPATARHIAEKLARHFVADDPPPALTERIAATLLDTGGDLKACTRTLLGSDEAWGPPTKMKLPQEFLWSALRVLDIALDSRRAMRAMEALGQPFWNPPSPAGFPDDAPSWLAADAVSDRLDFAEQLALGAEPDIDPVALLDTVLGPDASHATRSAVALADSRTQALALLLMSPEFQRR